MALTHCQLFCKRQVAQVVISKQYNESYVRRREQALRAPAYNQDVNKIVWVSSSVG